MALERPLTARVHPSEVAAQLGRAEAQLCTAWRTGERSHALALVVSTLAAHGRMLHYVDDLEARTGVDFVALARVRWSLSGHADAVKASTRATTQSVVLCHRYLKAAAVELQRLTEAMIESQWEASGEIPGRFSRREATAP